MDLLGCFSKTLYCILKLSISFAPLRPALIMMYRTSHESEPWWLRSIAALVAQLDRALRRSLKRGAEPDVWTPKHISPPPAIQGDALRHHVVRQHNAPRPFRSALAIIPNLL